MTYSSIISYYNNQQETIDQIDKHLKSANKAFKVSFDSFSRKYTILNSKEYSIAFFEDLFSAAEDLAELPKVTQEVDRNGDRIIKLFSEINPQSCPNMFYDIFSGEMGYGGGADD